MGQYSKNAVQNKCTSLMVMAFRVTVGAFFLCCVFFPSESKVYNRCELAHEFRDVYKFPEEELGTWLCIAYYESLFNTSALNPGSGDHGLFQISEQFWCSPADAPETVLPCGLPCAVYEDDDIEDDVECAKRVFKHHKKVSGDGFTGWVVYNSHCKNPVRVAAFLEGCLGNGSSTTSEISSTAAPSSSSLAISTAFRFPKLLFGRTASFRSTTSSPSFSISAQPSSPKPPIKAFKYKPLRPQVSSKPPLKFSPKYRPTAKFSTLSSPSLNDVSIFSPGVHRFSSSTSNLPVFSTSFKPFVSFSSTSAPKVTQFRPFGGFSTASPLKKEESKYGGKGSPLDYHQSAYAIVNNEGHSFAIGPSGFKIVWTGQ